MRSIQELHEKYGIPCVEVTTRHPPKPLPEGWDVSGPARPEILAIAERMIEEHRDVLRALAKR